MFKKKLAFILCVMLVLSLAGYAVCKGVDGEETKGEDTFLLVTSFYPMYILAQNLTTRAESVEVVNLTENQTGCLHDYQLTTKDMKLLTRADAFLTNGAGMELFMEKVLSQAETLPVIEASHGITLLEGSAHHHEHEQEEAEEHHEHEENGHVWMDVARYRTQLMTVKEVLKELLPEKKAQLEEAAASYDAELELLAAELAVLAQEVNGQPVVTFHDAFVYLAESLSMEVIGSLALDEETTPSAGEIAEVIEEIKYHGSALLLIEESYVSHAEKIAAETGAKIVYLDPLVTGSGEADSYLTGMRKNLSAVREAVLE